MFASCFDNIPNKDEAEAKVNRPQNKLRSSVKPVNRGRITKSLDQYSTFSHNNSKSRNQAAMTTTLGQEKLMTGLRSKLNHGKLHMNPGNLSNMTKKCVTAAGKGGNAPR